MRIWLVTRGILVDHDEQATVMVLAEDEFEARSKAAATHGPEGVDVWFDRDRTFARAIGEAYSHISPDTRVRDVVHPAESAK